MIISTIVAMRGDSGDPPPISRALTDQSTVGIDPVFILAPLAAILVIFLLVLWFRERRS